MSTPTPPIRFGVAASEVRAHVAGCAVEVPDDLVARLRLVCGDVRTDAPTRAEASRDWWPLGLHWSLAGGVGGLAAAVARPTTTAEVAGVVAACAEVGVPVTTAGGRSGVCGASVPVFGGVVLDTTRLDGILAVDEVSGLVDVAPGTMGDVLEHELRTHWGLTVGHWPQSMALATVGGWVACRGAGQYSTRYGKIEDLVVGLEVVLADGTVVATGGAPRAAAGPELTQLFLGSEGTLGVITRVTLRARPVPPVERRAAYAFASFGEGLEACRRILRRGATPAVLRLYDEPESTRAHGTEGDAVLLVLDEAEPALLDATLSIVAEECAGARDLGDGPVDRWFAHRNDTSALQALTERGFVVDTMEVAGPWSALPRLYDATCAALLAVPHARVATCHLSHSYPDGACLYFTFAAIPPPDAIEATYVACWDAGQRAALAAGGNLSHHHGVGLNRARFAAEALGAGHGVLAALKRALDPAGILNPGKLGLPSPYGEVPWP